MGRILEVPDDLAGERLDRVLADLTGVSRRAIVHLIGSGRVVVNGRPGIKGQLVAAGDRLDVAGELPTQEALRPVPEPDLPIRVVYTDGAIVVVDKPAGVPTHPLKAGERGTLAGALVARFPGCSSASLDPREAGLAHRLDTDTSGLLVAGRTRTAWDRLRAAFRAGDVEKEYLAIVVGVPPERFTVDLPLAGDPKDPRKVIAAVGAAHRGRALPAITEVTRVRKLRGCALVRVRAHTGRRHQIRVHLAHMGYPLLGDRLYGTGRPAPLEVPGHLLHAERLTIPHPSSGQRVTFEVEPPDDFQLVLEELAGG
ncbi:MAG TPA: RluA family pseudouridine synthase [Polyangia bacterium]|jgi:23S rRNA pseudouridine1911/1915/1917 synthase